MKTRKWGGEPTEKELQKRFKQQIAALNTINSSRMIWSMTDAIEVITRIGTKEQKEDVIKSIETIIRVWTKTLKELKLKI